MNVKHTVRNVETAYRAILLCCLLGLTRGAQAQEILMPAPEYSTAPPAVREYQTSQMQVFAPSGGYSGVQQESTPLHWGPAILRPHLFYRFLYADGLPSSQGTHVSSFVQSVAPGILLGMGSHWTLDYTPSWTFYTSRDMRNTLDHSVRLTGGTAYEDWTFGLVQSYASSSAPLVETGTQTDQQNFVTDLSASYRFNSTLSTDLALNQTINEVSSSTLSGFRQWSLADWLNYQFWPRLDAAIGASVGFADPDIGPDMLFEGLQARGRWRATDKLSFQVHGGMEIREFLSGTADNLINPIMAATIQYQPVETTMLSLNVDRTVAAAYLQDSVSETTQVGVKWNQRLLEVLYFDLAGSYSTIRYVSTTVGTQTRQDDYYSVNAGLHCRLLKRGTVAVFYQHSKNTSTDAGFSLASNQVGFELGYRF